MTHKTSPHETIKAFFKKHKLPEELKQAITKQIGQTRSLSEILTELLTFYKTNFEDYPSEVSDPIAISYLRELMRTCNPNDNKFNSKKYGEAYQAGRHEYIRNIGTDLLQTVGKHVENLKTITNTVELTDTPMTPKEYASIGKDILQMVKLYQAIASAPEPASDAPLDMMLPTQTENALTDTTLAIAEEPEEENAENKPD